MDVAKEVILDLLPVYFSGDASAETRALVDEFFAQNPGLAEDARRQWSEPLLPAPPSGPTPNVALQSLHRTRRMLATQRWLFAVAMMCTVLPLSVELSFDNGRIDEWHFLIRDYPEFLLPVLGAGITCWMAYVFLRRR